LSPEGWFASRGWTPLAFQREAWAAYARGESGLVHVPTGAGKTYAAALPALLSGAKILYISPLRAMATDIRAALQVATDECGLDIRVETRTGDTSSSVRARQRARLPEVLVTTPESLCLLLTDPGAPDRFSDLSLVVVDEWHELVDAKRGSLLELALTRLRRFSPGLRTWALSATLANVEEAAQVVVGAGAVPTIIRADLPRPVVIETLLPPRPEVLPLAGHFGLTMLPVLVASVDISRSTLVFCNTRAQAERWYQGLLRARPDWADRMGLHHGSIDHGVRLAVERGLKSGAMTLVVCTASLDLGVDLAPVERVVQVGSPKGIGRLVQRAGRSGHRPGATCRVLCVPTHALQLVEIAAVRDALSRREVEARRPMRKPLDVLAQHLVSCALGGGFRLDEMRSEVRRAWSFRDLSDQEFDWALALVRDGGHSLRAYPNFRKVREVDGLHTVPDAQIARLHRASVGTIVGESVVSLRRYGGGEIGTIDEGFVSRLNVGDTFVFAGETLELVMIKDMVAWARRAKKRGGATPHWPGNKLPISGSLGVAVRRTLAALRDGEGDAAELEAWRPFMEVQRRLSRLPGAAVLAESCTTEDGAHLFVYPFEGRSAHEGLAALLARRMGQREPATFTMAVNDYGFEILAHAGYRWALEGLFDEARLADDVVASVNISELTRRRFREVARVAGLVFPGLPGRAKSARQLQASASLLFDVFHRYEPENLLLAQARREVLEQSFQLDRLRQALARLRAGVELVEIERPGPLAFPLVLERLAVDSASLETLEARIERMRREWTSS
jgi:ATP-dependent Lhr-like helicase